MDTQSLIAAVDEEITRLEQVKALLSGMAAGKKRGRPATSSAHGANVSAPKKRMMSADAKAKIREAQKKRWAAFHKNQAAAKQPAKQAASK